MTDSVSDTLVYYVNDLIASITAFLWDIFAWINAQSTAGVKTHS